MAFHLISVRRLPSISCSMIDDRGQHYPAHESVSVFLTANKRNLLHGATITPPSGWQHTETLVVGTLFCPAPLMTRIDETQTPMARLLSGPAAAVCSLCLLLCCATAVRWFAVCLRAVCGCVCVPCANPGKKTPFTSLEKCEFHGQIL